jgi:hypothetical protein
MNTPSEITIQERKGHECFGPDAIECLLCVGPAENAGNAFASVSLGGPGATSSKPEDVRATAQLLASAPKLRVALKSARDELRRQREIWTGSKNDSWAIAAIDTELGRIEKALNL